MNYFAHIDANTGKVYAVSEAVNIIVPAPANDPRLLGTTYDGQFIGYKITLTADKPEIYADGVDTATITATVYTWDDQIALDYAENIIFEFEGQQDPVTPINGVATIPFASNEAGDFVIKTVNGGQYIMSNGQITVKAVLA